MENVLHCNDCVKGMGRLPEGCVDLAFADPPFNIGYDYDVYDDRQAAEHYLDWTREWGKALHPRPEAGRHLLAGHRRRLRRRAEADLPERARLHLPELGHLVLHVRRELHEEIQPQPHAPVPFCQATRSDSRSTTDAIRVPSARQLVYADTRANRKGRLPDDTWVLRPQDLPEGFRPDEDTWYFPRVCGTFKERAGWHGCQMPEQLLGRIIKVCSNAGELVLDPFGGSGTTLVVAKKLGRRFRRLRDVEKVRPADPGPAGCGARAGDPLNGAEEPTVSAPETPAGPLRRKRRRQRTRTGAGAIRVTTRWRAGA